MKYLLFTLIVGLIYLINDQPTSKENLSSIYKGEEVQLLGPGVISTDMGEYNPTYDTERQELYFMRRTPGVFDYTIYRSQLKAEGWTTPAVAPFSGEYRDDAPYLSPDGNTLYFDSRRPTDAVDVDDSSISLWKSERKANSWSAPELLPQPSANNPNESETGLDEFGPAVDGNGNYFFYSFRQPYRGGARYSSMLPKLDEVALDKNIPDPSARTFVSYLYINSEANLVLMEGKAPGRWDRDLYCSCKNSDGTWLAPMLIPRINTRANESGPYLTNDGQYLLFSSNRRTANKKASYENLYLVKATSLLNECTSLCK